MGGGFERDDFDQVFDEMFLPAFHVAHRILSNVTDAEDAAAEALARALRSWDRVGRMPYRNAWIMRVAANVAIDRARRPKQSSRVPDIADQDRSDHVVMRVGLATALASLSKRQREVLSLRYLGDLSEADVASSLGISVNSVKTHTLRGVAAMREHMGPSWEADLALD
jgi:RNA polymerase sigma factor (sigma-70 family)